jgi:ariadne-1
MICFEDFSRKDVRSAACKHGFCVDCWKGYITAGIGSGPAVLDLRCPLPPCKAEVGLEGRGGGSGGRIRQVMMPSS